MHLPRLLLRFAKSIVLLLLLRFGTEDGSDGVDGAGAHAEHEAPQAEEVEHIHSLTTKHSQPDEGAAQAPHYLEQYRPVQRRYSPEGVGRRPADQLAEDHPTQEGRRAHGVDLVQRGTVAGVRIVGIVRVRGGMRVREEARLEDGQGHGNGHHVVRRTKVADHGRKLVRVEKMTEEGVVVRRGGGSGRSGCCRLFAPRVIFLTTTSNSLAAARGGAAAPGSLAAFIVLHC